MKYLLDTNALIDYLRGQKALVKKIDSTGEIVTSSIVAAEFYVGFHATNASKSKLALAETKRLFKKHSPLSFDSDDGKETGRLIATFGLVKERAIYRDVMIAAQAKMRSLTVITNNTSDFFRIVGLKVENWTIE